MNNELTSLPGYQLHEYLLVLQPHEDLRNKIQQLKQEFAKAYGAPLAEKGAVQLALLRFSQLRLMEERICNKMNAIAMATKPFRVELSNYGSVPTHTVHIEVQTKSAIQLLVKSLKPAQSLLKTKEVKPQYMQDFTVRLAGKLLPWQFEKAWLEYSHRQFSGSFMANKMLLLRRDSTTIAYTTVQRFSFLNTPVASLQGLLF